MAGDEGALAAKAMKGDRDAFAELVEMFHRRIFALSCSLVGDYHAAEDAAQETFLRAFKAIKTLKDPAKVGAWLAGIAYRVSRSHLRNEKGKAQPFHPGLPDSMAFLVQEAPGKDLKARVLDAANGLPEDARALLALKYLEGLSYAEIGEILEVEAKTVKSRLFSARKLLRDRLGSYRPKE